MSFEATGDRWQAAATTACTGTLADRWQITTRQWLEAKAESLNDSLSSSAGPVEAVAAPGAIVAPPDAPTAAKGDAATS